MNPSTLLIVLISITLSAVAQVTMKYGVSQPDIQRNLAEPITVLGYLATNGYVLAGLSLYGISAVFWLFVLARLDVTVAYPFIGIGFLLTMVFGAMALGEPIGALRIIGTLLVVTGVALVAQS